ncbi:zinc finger protein 62 homolog isoform X2 [Culex pipiens pallens]|uniref:zinc finger protein 62 homolog isoform X2 n=1 Tax=Culex pipiens pallens TaxID=42434 RepID=UPI0019543AC3|nr:zinc finger protein 62 homolog isoform X2 [Culex pipiens pallens]
MDKKPKREQLADEPNDSFPCSFEGCGKVFPSLTAQCTHEAVCSRAGAAPRLSCEICGSRTYKLKQHMVLHRPPEHQCPVCRKMFHYRYNLTAHLRVHAKELDPLGEGSYEGTQFLLRMVDAAPRIPKKKPEPQSFSCTVCPAVFKASKTLRFHLNAHEGLTPFACRNEGCQEAFANPQQRFHHEPVCRGESGMKQCHECDQEFDMKSFSKHMRSAHQVVQRDRNAVIKSRWYPCGQCPAVLKSAKTLACHVNQHKGIKPYPCRNEGCQEQFAWDNNRRHHEKRCRESSSVCPVCGIQLANGSVRQQHMAAFHKDDAVLEELLKLEIPLDESPKTEQRKVPDPDQLPDGRMECPECGKIFRQRHGFVSHMNKHKGVRPYACVKCAREFFSKQAHAYHEKKCVAGLKLRRAPGSNPLKSDERKIPKEKKAPTPMVKTPAPPPKLITARKRLKKIKAVPKQCELCNQILRSERAYEYHMEVHNGAGIYRCKAKDCEETFQTVRERQLHEAERHGGRMPEEPKQPKEQKTYMCEICSTVCLRKKSFISHMNAHNGIKKLVCRNEGCAETFYSHSARQSHEEPCRGEVITCPVCDIKVKTKNILRIHLRRQHPDQLPPSRALLQKVKKDAEKKTFPCTLCSRVFRTPKSLGEHVNDHTGAKPFQCRNEGCTEGFARRVARIYHEEGCRGLVAPCPFCDIVLKNSRTLKNHVASCHPAEKESFDKGIFSYQDQLVQRSELEKMMLERAEREQAEEVDETPNDEIKCEVDDEMPVEWLEDIIEEADLGAKLLEIKDEVIVESAQLCQASSLDNPDGIQVELENVEIKAEVDDETDSQTDEEDDLLVDPFNEPKEKTQLPAAKLFKCRNDNGCQQIFESHQSRTHHEPRCRGETFWCPRTGCKYGPTTKLDIEQHLLQKHGDEKENEETTKVKEDPGEEEDEEDDSSGKGKFKCEECWAIFKHASSLKYHLNRHKGATPFSCQNPGCGRSFASPGERRIHNCQGQVTARTCPMCPTSFQNQNRLWYHIRTKHGENVNNDQRHDCAVCGASYVLEKSLRIHMRKHDGTLPYRCRKKGCDKGFRSSDRRCYHELSCGEAGVECTICKVQLRNNKTLANHMKKVHQDGLVGSKRDEHGSLMCEICSRTFNRNCDLTNHKKTHVEPKDELEASTIDVGNGLVKCGVCSKYLQKKTYQYHLNSHRGVRQYPCSNCPQGFFSKQAQWYHEKKCLAGQKMRKTPRVYIKNVETEPTEPIVFKCPDCPSTFPNRYTLYHHKQRHLGPIVCTEGCNKSFSRVDLLRKHMRDCHGIGEKAPLKMEKTLKCDFCPLMFGFKASLVRHMKLHDDSSRASCTNQGCNQTFANEKALQKHLASCSSTVSINGEQ